MAGYQWWGEDWNKYHSTAYYPGNFESFASFLYGTCYLANDQEAYQRVAQYGYTDFGKNTTVRTCNATSTCGDGHGPPAASPEAQEELARTQMKYAVGIAQSLIAASAAYAITNQPATSDANVEPAVARESSGQPYKALVVFFMAGGADTFNMLIPHSNCDGRNVSDQYSSTRGAAALNLDDLLTIDVPTGTQPCDTMGLHNRLSILQELWEDGDAAFLANIGPLVEPLTKEQFLDLDGQVPAGLYAHNLQTQGSKTLYPQSTTGDTGILGRIFQAFDEQAVSSSSPIKGAAYSITSDRTMFRGSTTDPILLSSTEGMLTYDGSQSSAQSLNYAERDNLVAAFERLVARESGSIFAETHNAALRSALVESDRIARLLDNITLSQDWGGAIGQASVGAGQDFVAQVEQVASVIAGRNAFKAERDVFYVELGGFDTHSDVVSELDTKFGDVNTAISTFVAEMKDMGLWDQVTLVSLSEFGRTMTSNGAGTDHAWGGNHFVIGGGIKGGTIHGEYPELRVDGPQSVSSTGPMLPTTPWEGLWVPLARWIGVEEDYLDGVMPNLPAFSDEHLLTLEDLYE